ncbi:MAG: peptidoglycan DD-metalloendopeptidase family protein [Marmoricola sp.]
MVRHSRSHIKSAKAVARQRAMVAAIAFALAATVTVPSAQADGLKDKKHRVEHSITTATADLEDSSHAAVRAQQRLQSARVQLRTARHQLASTRDRLAAARDLDRRMQADLAQARQDLVDATAALELGVRQVAEQRAKVGRYAADSMQRADPQLVGLVAMINADDPANLTTEMKTVGNIMGREDVALGQLRDARTQLQVRERQVQAARDAVAAKAKDAAVNLVLREQLEQQAAADARSVAGLVHARQQARRTALSAERSDQKQLVALKKENNRIASMLAARARRSTEQGNSTTQGSSTRQGSSSGPLMQPVTGYVTSPFGWRIHPIFGYRALHDGTDFHAPCGTPLRAAGNGTVISEYPQTAWGNRLIMDLGRVNGHGVSVIYNHISAYRVQTGAHVTPGETVAYAGTTGWSTACHLHFTVMVDGVPQDPLGWF